MIVFRKTTLDDDVKNWSYDKLKEFFEGKLDYVALAKQLGIKKTRKKSSDD